MRKSNALLLSIFFWSLLFLTSTWIYPQADTVVIKQQTKKLIKAEILKAEFKNLEKFDDEGIVLHKELAKAGFKPAVKNSNYWGQAETYTDKLGRQLKAETYIRDYEKAGSKDKAALAQVVLSLGKRSEVYTFYLIAKEGDFSKVEEYFVGSDMKVSRANSWWSCVRSRLLKCAGPCVAALGTCTGTWAAYLGCVAVACGGCYAGIAACCGCNCKWWCKWAVGCCRN